jgi:hypothetical protein
MGKNKNHRTRAQARRIRRAMMLRRRARYDRMRGAADNWRREACRFPVKDSAT